MLDAVTGFVDPSTSSTGGFNFNSFLNSVGGSLNTWAVGALNRQVNKDTADRHVETPPESALPWWKQKTNLIIGGVVGVVLLWVFRKKLF